MKVLKHQFSGELEGDLLEGSDLWPVGEVHSMPLVLAPLPHRTLEYGELLDKITSD